MRRAQEEGKLDKVGLRKRDYPGRFALCEEDDKKRQHIDGYKLRVLNDPFWQSPVPKSHRKGPVPAKYSPFWRLISPERPYKYEYDDPCEYHSDTKDDDVAVRDWLRTQLAGPFEMTHLQAPPPTHTLAAVRLVSDLIAVRCAQPSDIVVRFDWDVLYDFEAQSGRRRSGYGTRLARLPSAGDDVAMPKEAFIGAGPRSIVIDYTPRNCKKNIGKLFSANPVQAGAPIAHMRVVCRQKAA